ncbi:site-specific tyrosine recombinase/integron integrase [Frisingicoccus sp.]|uniref:site-specific tyrosine recombinase/integron integrase n=1 Tax=Frisingicoccus sp. TaxID=1918627 RepID=UPI003AB77B1A
MKNELINSILDAMCPCLNSDQMHQLKTVLHMAMYDYSVSQKETEIIVRQPDGYAYLDKFLLSKSSAGLSPRTLDNYRLTITMFLDAINKPLAELTDDDFIYYLERYRQIRQVSFSRIKNMQSALSSFFSWLHKKRYIPSNPVAQLDSIKLPKTIKKPFSDEDREMLKIQCEQLRDLALMEFLYSTGVRVSELTSLNRSDINFNSNDVTVFGKGSKERETYITPSAGIYLKMYLNSRTDDNPALFVSLHRPYHRLSKNGVERMLRELGRRTGIKNVHPHRFRRTMATNALNRGMPIEQVSRLLGHTKLDTTQIYCSVSQENVRMSHKKYLSA